MDQLLLSAFIEQITRIANALEHHNAMLFAAQPDRPAPNLQRKLEDYAGFDWDTIGAHVEAFDRHGATEVSWNGRIFKRYRSTEDDDKGQDIRFRRVASGTVAEKNLKWETLIKFGGNRKPAKPLRGELAEKIEHKQGNVPLNPPVATLGERIAATAPAQPQQHIEIPAELRRDWLHWHDQTAKFGNVPAELGLYDVDTIASVKDKIAALVKVYESNVAATLNTACDQLAALLADAKQAGVEVPAEFYDIDHATLDVIELRIGTVRNLIAAKQGAQTMTQPTPQQPPPQSSALVPSPSERVSGEMVIDTAGVIRDLRSAAVKSGGRVMNKWQAAEIVQALESIAGSKERRQQFTKIVFERESYADLSDAQRYALHAWLRPAKRNNASMSTNPRAAIELRAVLAAQSEGREVPA
jgi:hypothetical protein